MRETCKYTEVYKAKGISTKEGIYCTSMDGPAHTQYMAMTMIILSDHKSIKQEIKHTHIVSLYNDPSSAKWTTDTIEHVYPLLMHVMNEVGSHSLHVFVHWLFLKSYSNK